MMTTQAEGDSILFYGKVEKFGADGSSLRRSVFVTPSALLVSLPAGGITRTIMLANLIELCFPERETSGSFRCTVQVRNEPVLTLDFPNRNNLTLFTDAVRGAASHVRIVHSGDDDFRERHVVLDVPRTGTKGVRFVEPPAFSGTKSSSAGLSSGFSPGNSYNGNTHHRLSCPSFSVAPREPLEGVGNSTGDTQRGSTLITPSDTHISPFRRELFLHALGSPNEKNASMQINESRDDNGDECSYRLKETPSYVINTSGLCVKDITQPLTHQQTPTSGARLLQLPEEAGLQEDLAGEFHAEREVTNSTQQHHTAELEILEQTVGRLKDELREKNVIADDLKLALQSLESVFQEMLKTTEQLRLTEGFRNELEKQVELLRAEVKHLESLLKQHEEKHSKEMATKLAELHEAHLEEVESLKEAFAVYDSQMTEYVGNVEKEKDREAQNWNEKERLLQKQIKCQQDEIAELMSALASQPDKNSFAALHMPAEGNAGIGWKSKHELPSSQEMRETPCQSRQTAPAAFTTPAVEYRLASLEDELLRNRLREKVDLYAEARRRALQRSSFAQCKDNDDIRSESVNYRDPYTNSGISPRSFSRRLLSPMPKHQQEVGGIRHYS